MTLNSIPGEIIDEAACEGARFDTKVVLSWVGCV